MATILQLRRGTTTQHSSFTGAVGEVTVDTTKKTVVVHDGTTAGGSPLATEAYVATQIQTKDNSDEITEGSTNLYFTNARARGAFSAGTGITITDGAISTSITQYTDASARSAISAGTGISYNSSTGVISSSITQYTDALARSSLSFTAGSGAYNSTTGVITIPTNTSQLTNGANFITLTSLSGGTGISYNNTTGAISADTTTIATKTYVDNKISDLVGGASAAYDTLKEIQDAMATDAELSAAIAAITIGNATQTITAGSYLTGGGTFTANQTTDSSVTLAVDAASANTASKIVARDASGNFSAGTITATLSGNASTATKLATARTINGTSFDGSANITFGTDSVSEGTTNKYFTDARARGVLSGGTGITYTSSTGDISVDTSTIATKTYVDSAVAAKDNTDEITEGTTNLYFTTARARGSISAGTGISYNSTTGVVSNSGVTTVNGSSGAITNIAVTTGKLSQFAATSSSELAGVISDETGSGALVFATSPTLVTPTLGVASATSVNKVAITAPATSATLTIADGKTLTASNTLTFTGTDSSSVAFGSGGTVAYTSNKLSAFAATSSSELAGVISDETGSGALVFANSPTLVTPALGTPSSVTLTNATGLPVSTGISGLGTGVATFLATPSSANLASALTDETGTGKVVFSADPTFTGTANFANISITGNLTVSGTTTTVNSTNVSYTDNIIELHNTADSSPLTTDDGKDVGIRFHYYKGADKHAFAGWANDTGAFEYYSDGTETNGVFSGTYGKFKGSGHIITGSTSGTTTVVAAAAASGTLTLPAATDTLVGKATTDTLTNKTISGSSNTLSNIGNSSLTNSSITVNGSTISLGGTATIKASTTNALTIGTGLSGTSFDGGSAVTIAIDSSVVTLSGTQTLTNKTLTSPTLTTPTLGVATATTINKVTITAPATGSTITVADGKTLTASNTLTFTGTDGSSVAFGAGGTVAYTSNKLSAFAATSSSELAGVISDETGSGALVFANSPTLVTPALGTPSSVTLTNATGLPVSTGISGLGTGVATFLATPSSANLAAAVTDETGSGALVFATAPALSAPTVSTGAAVSAAGSTQGTATALTNDYVVVTTVASGAGVALPTGTAGRRIVIVNKGANTLTIYPASGGTIDALSANAGIQIAANGTIELMAASSTQWYSIDRVAVYDASGNLLN